MSLANLPPYGESAQPDNTNGDLLGFRERFKGGTSFAILPSANPAKPGYRLTFEIPTQNAEGKPDGYTRGQELYTPAQLHAFTAALAEIQGLKLVPKGQA